MIWTLLLIAGIAHGTYDVLALKQCASGDGYSIHGLWPDYNSTSWPAFCNNASIFNIDQVRSLLPMMHKFWYTCPGVGTDISLWTHEWSKHGTCTNMTQHNFFNLTVELYLHFPWANACPVNATQCFIPISF